MKMFGMIRRWLAVGCLIQVAWFGPSAPAQAAPVATKPAQATSAEPEMDFIIVRGSHVKCEPNCPQWISAEGRIVVDTARKLAAVLKDAKLHKLPLVLNSGGGSIQAALAMGRMVRHYKMETAVGRTVVTGCSGEARHAGTCKLDRALGAFEGTAFASRAQCSSACPLVLLGGAKRIVDLRSFIGLHEPKGLIQPYVDQYLVKYRMVHGKKQIISRTFVKRSYQAKQTVIGLTPKLRGELANYLNEMGGSREILVEMEKAKPEAMNWINADNRLKLGLATADAPGLEDLVGLSACNKGNPRPGNCIFLKAKSPAVARPFER